MDSLATSRIVKGQRFAGWAPLPCRRLEPSNEIEAGCQCRLARLPIGWTSFPLAFSHSYGRLQFPQRFSDLSPDTVVMNFTRTKHAIGINQEGSSKSHSLLLHIDAEFSAQRPGRVRNQRKFD